MSIMGGETMKGKLVLLIGMVVVGLGLVGTPASWANSYDFQGLTFSLNVNGGGDLVLGITGTVNDPNWTGVDSLKAFSLTNYGTAGGTITATGGGTTWTYNSGGLSNAGAGGCNLAGPGFCFSGNAAFPENNPNLSVTIHATSGSWNLDLLDSETGLYGPHLKVCFADGGVACKGSLLGTTIPTSTPEPTSLLLLGAGMIAMGISRRKLA